MSISAIYQELFSRSRTSHAAEGRTLTGGARLTVRVQNGLVVLTIARRQKGVGDTEEQTFLRDCSVPPGAVRRPAEGQNRMMRGQVVWWYLSYTWPDEEEATNE